MASVGNSHPIVRLNFSKIEKIVEIPNLIDVQRQSYESFLQIDVSPEDRQDVGLQAVFKSVFPIRDFNGTASLEFVSYTLGEPKYEVDECRQRGMTFAAPLKVVVRLITYEVDEEERKGRPRVRDIKEQEVYFGEIPLMTDKGTFVINGTERVIVSQLHRSPGILFEHEKGKTHTGKPLYSGRIIPHRGSWLDLEFDTKGLLYVRIDRRRKLPVTVLIRALGLSAEDILKYFYRSEKVTFKDDKILKNVDFDLLANKRANEDIANPQTGEVLVRKNRKITRPALKKLADAKIKAVVIDKADLAGRFLAQDVRRPETGDLLFPANTELTPEKVDEMRAAGIKEFSVIFIDQLNISSSLRDTLAADRIDDGETRPIEEHRKENPGDKTPNAVYNSILEIYRRLRPSEPPTLEAAKSFFENLFFNPDRYDLSRVGRLKINHRLKLEAPPDLRVLRKEDILETVRYLIELKDGAGEVDDIDHLGNRRVRAVGELLENQYRIGLVRMERAIKERMSLQDVETLMPHDLINPKPVTAVVKEFFGSSQLSQFMDQTNPLSEITHKRRLSALGPGGLTRERAGFEVRDVHPTHYGRICPIETPEGPNIGLIASLSTYAKVDEFGFIVTPYRQVTNGQVTREIEYLSALQEDESRVIAQANAPVDEKGRFTAELVPARIAGESTLVRPEEINLMDVSPNQLVSVAASLIPFLENDDANRALMGSNMQRQAVPLLRAEAPLVGTGMEGVVARDSGVTIVAERDGTVEKVDSARIIVRAENAGRNGGREVDIYNLVKYQRSNQNTCINQKPIVLEGQRVKKGQVIADGPATESGELALGRNVLVAFMPWGGYNFEDSILISERVVKDDSFTSIHIEEFEVVARDTKLGREEITQDIPNLGEESLKNLDESGIVRIGAEVKAGDILVGKITPKGETQPSPEEKLLRAIFGEKAGAVKDTSLRVPPGVDGIVIGAKIFSRRGVEKDSRAKAIEEEEIARIHRDQEDEISIVRHLAAQRARKILLNEVSTARLTEDRSGKTMFPKNTKLTKEVLAGIPDHRLQDVVIQNAKKKAELDKIWEQQEERVQVIRTAFEKKISRLKKADELPPGVIKMVKVDVAMKRKLSVGDKMAGRHGNKGVISRILPEEDMPYLEDGTAVDIVLNPLGVPSRMNVGQILETHLGWAAKGLGEQISRIIEREYSPKALREKIKGIYGSEGFAALIDSFEDDEIQEYARIFSKGIYMASPAFDGATEDEIKKALKQSGLPMTGQVTLFDGRTGTAFEQKVTVGVIYMMKLHHLVDDKIHARSVGPYSLITQQPLGGKAQFGGQRLGEMEVWALEAYGASYGLQEFLTVKSDDVLGRTRMYETIVKGGHTLEAGVPESFNVLVKELQSLCLDMELLEEREEA